MNAAVGNYKQFPHFYKIFQSPYNKALEGSQAIHYIMGFEYLIASNMQVKVEGYYKSLSHLPVQVNDTSFIFHSEGERHSKGVEITFTQKMTGNLYLLVNYSLSNSIHKDSSDGISYPFIYNSPHMLNVMATFRLTNWWEFSLISRYSSGFPYTPFDLASKYQRGDEWFCQYGKKNSARLPDYYRLDARVDRKFIYKNWNLSFFLEIWNITNNQNVVKYEYNADFTERDPVPSMFGLMPMFGILAEF